MIFFGRKKNPSEARFADFQAHCNRGVAYSEMGQFEGTVREFKKAIRLLPDLAFAHFCLGAAYGELGRYEDAVGEYKEAIRLGLWPGDDALAHLGLGIVYARSGRRQDALNEYETLKILDKVAAGKLFKLISL